MKEILFFLILSPTEDVRKIVDREDSTGASDRLRETFLARKKRVVLKRAYQKRAVADTTTVEVKQAVQIALPMAEVLTSLEQGLGELVRKVGRIFIESVLESEVE